MYCAVNACLQRGRFIVLLPKTVVLQYHTGTDAKRRAWCRHTVSHDQAPGFQCRNSRCGSRASRQGCRQLTGVPGWQAGAQRRQEE